jgi:hypothetical protein
VADACDEGFLIEERKYPRDITGVEPGQRSEIANTGRLFAIDKGAHDATCFGAAQRTRKSVFMIRIFSGTLCFNEQARFIHDDTGVAREVQVSDPALAKTSSGGFAQVWRNYDQCSLNVQGTGVNVFD